jgi:hypothetical protein
MKHTWFQWLLVSSFLVTVVLELYGIFQHDYTISDFILEHVRMRWRVALAAWLVFHFIFEYPTYK